jgi:hypothetical protein
MLGHVKKENEAIGVESKVAVTCVAQGIEVDVGYDGRCRSFQ